jgi:DNA polymerase-3 subunit alpha
MVEDFISRKHGRQEMSYIHPSLEPILQEPTGSSCIRSRSCRWPANWPALPWEKPMACAGPGQEEGQGDQGSARQICDRAGQKGISEDKSSYIFDLMEHFAVMASTRATVQLMP